MSLIAILAALGLEQWHAFHWRASIERAFVLLARRLEQRLNGGTRTQGSIALLIAVVPPVVLAAALWWAADTVHPLLGLLANIVVLYCLMGFRRFSHAASMNPRSIESFAMSLEPSSPVQPPRHPASARRAAGTSPRANAFMITDAAWLKRRNPIRQ